MFNRPVLRLRKPAGNVTGKARLDFIFGFITMELGEARYPQVSELGNGCEVNLPSGATPHLV